MTLQGDLNGLNNGYKVILMTVTRVLIRLQVILMTVTR